MKPLYATLLFLLFSFLCLNAQITESQIEKVDHLFKKWDQKDSPGAAVGIIQKGKLIYKGITFVKDEVAPQHPCH